jgi:hypothetical protein
MKDKYSYFLGPLKLLVTIETESKTGKSLLVFKDSYAHSLAPMLMDQYEKIVLVDLRNLVGDLEDIIHIEDYDEILYIYSTETFSQNLLTSKLG